MTSSHLRMKLSWPSTTNCQQPSIYRRLGGGGLTGRVLKVDLESFVEIVSRFQVRVRVLPMDIQPCHLELTLGFDMGLDTLPPRSFLGEGPGLPRLQPDQGWPFDLQLNVVGNFSLSAKHLRVAGDRELILKSVMYSPNRPRYIISLEELATNLSRSGPDS